MAVVPYEVVDFTARVIYADSAHCEITGRPDGGNGDSQPIPPDHAGDAYSFGSANLPRRRLNFA
jgi:hypothetical protein